LILGKIVAILHCPFLLNFKFMLLKVTIPLVILNFFAKMLYAQLAPVPVKIPNNIDNAVATFAADAQLSNAAISFYVYDIDRATIISEYNPKMSLPTASTMKLVTTATALEILGSGTKFTTKIQYDGTFDSVTGILNGNLYIKGGGDPTLGSKLYAKDSVDIMQEWVDAVLQLGIKKITGRVIGDATFFSDEFVPANWSWGDMGNYYGAGVSGLSIYDNLVRIWFKGGANVDDSTWVTCYEPYTPDLRIENRVKTGAITGDEVYMYGAPYASHRIVKGRIPKSAEDIEVRVSMHEPDYVCAYEFQHKLIQNCVQVENSATTVRRLLLLDYNLPKERVDILKVLSPAVSSIVYWTNLISNNLYAEHLLKHIGVSRFGDGSFYSSTAAVDKFWRTKGLDMTGFYMTDGCGLARANAASAKHLVDILVYMKTKSKYKGSFESSLPVAGKTGTMRNIGKSKNLTGNLKAKTGTMTRIKSFAGYLKCDSGKNLAFSIIVNNYNCTAEEVSRKIENIMSAMASYNE
jgi:serine-type D-Ala-D-Ala carboxypeptidase/endopeptidase (penicillin-binding protein 4)